VAQHQHAKQLITEEAAMRQLFLVVLPADVSG
jgi:hypothetical protein